MYLVFDGGYFGGLGLGVWAVVLVQDGHEELLEYGHKRKTSSSDIEWEAAHRAALLADDLGVEHIKGDFLACIHGMARKRPEIRWEWVPSRSNIADKYAKYYPELIHEKPRTRTSPSQASD